ncbi:MAG: ABC transporter ATP-binding protein [Defluviitaleaceae bacterium]|nr:ABC transporter ATP-binding protein [Defluviitaleaceae bacterium]
MEKLLELKNLTTSFRIQGEFHAAVDGINLHINKDEIFAIVGESGSGKSATAVSIMKLHNPLFTRVSGEVLFNGRDLLPLKEAEMNKVRGREIGMIFQDPLNSLNPLMKIGAQIEESLIHHTDFTSAERKERAIELLNQVGIKDPERTYNSYPHELSGGMRQRVIIAIAIAVKPKLLIADEPTTALDVTIQAQILDLIRDLQKEIGSSIIMITHDLGVVAEMADRVAVMYAGQIVEIAPIQELFQNPKHPYTRSLLAAMPSNIVEGEKLNAIEGIVPPLQNMIRQGCRFAPRIPWIDASEHEENPQYHQVGENHYVLCSCHKTFRLKGE